MVNIRIVTVDIMDNESIRFRDFFYEVKNATIFWKSLKNQGAVVFTYNTRRPVGINTNIF